jgi:phosphate-selective porin
MRSIPLCAILTGVLHVGIASSQYPAATAASSTPPSVRLGGYLQARETYRDGVGLTGSINRARLTASGGLARNVTWRLQGEFRTGSVGNGKASASLTDAYIRWKPSDFGIQVGQFKTPFTREYLTSLADVETADRSTVVDSIAPKRDIGIMADYAFSTMATVALGVFNGENINVTANTDSSVLWVGRATVRPIAYITLGGNVASYQSDSTRYGVDLALEYMGAALKGEYIGQHRKGATGADDRGWYAQGTFRVLPWVQLVAKQEDFRRSAISAAVRNRATTGGINVEFGGGKVRLLANYVSRKIGTPGKRTGLLITQAQVKY